MGYDVTRFQGDVDEDLICPICSGVLEEPVQVSGLTAGLVRHQKTFMGNGANGEVPAQAATPHTPDTRRPEAGGTGAAAAMPGIGPSRADAAEVHSVQVFFGGELFTLSDGQLFVLLMIAWQLLFLFRGSN